MPSTVIKRIDYDAPRSCLTVTFTSGKAYRYDGVPADVYDAFQVARSKGSYFNRCIRDRYRTTLLPNRSRRQERSRSFAAPMRAEHLPGQAQDPERRGDHIGAAGGVQKQMPGRGKTPLIHDNENIPDWNQHRDGEHEADRAPGREKRKRQDESSERHIPNADGGDVGEP